MGNDPIDVAIQQKEQEQARENYRDSVETRRAKEHRLSNLDSRFRDLATTDRYTVQQLVSEARIVNDQFALVRTRRLPVGAVGTRLLPPRPLRAASSSFTARSIGRSEEKSLLL